MTAPRVRRGFVDVAAGQAHYRYADGSPNGSPNGSPGGAPPLIMIHASPGSAKMLEPLIRELARTRPVYAIDTLGNGDSSPPMAAQHLSDRPELAVFVEGQQQAITALGFDTFDLYGSHTGGNIAAEIALAWPDRVLHLVLDGMSLYSQAERDDLSAHYAPGIALESNGAHLLRAWSFVRDTYLFWPWYRHGGSHLRHVGLPALEVLHDKAIEVIKAVQTYHYSYNAAFLYRKETRLPLITTPTLLTCAEEDMLLPYMERVAALMPKAKKAVTPGAADARAASIRTFLEAAPHE